MDNLRNTIERWKARAEFFLKNKISAFIVDDSDNYYFCDITSFDEDYLCVKHFTGKREGENDKILWFEIVRFERYVKKEEVENDN